MHIEELTLENYKGFEQQTFRFNPGFNVIIGKNASGKTSLLDAVSIAVSGYITGAHGTNTTKIITEKEIRIANINGQPKPQLPLKITANIDINSKTVRTYNSVTNITISNTPQSSKLPIHSNDNTEIIDIAKNDVANSRSTGNTAFPILIYYGSARLSLKHENSPIEYMMQDEGIVTGYRYALLPNVTSSYFLSWYKTYEDEVSKFGQKNNIILLNAFKEAITSVVPSWSDIAFSNLSNDLIGTFKDSEGNINKLPYSNLSDGFRITIGMVADIAYRCIQLNPGLGEKVLLDTEGIVLIDEIDLHLHPEWQRNIVADLKKTFPRIQFIATTHSPFIVQSLSKDELIILDKDAEVGEDPWRKSVEEIATDEMQVHDMPRSSRFAAMNKLAKEYFTLLKQNDNNDTLRANINAAKQKLDYIRTYYSDDPAYVAMLEIELNKSEANATRNKD